MNLCVSKAIEKEVDTVWIDGQCFTVTRLPSTAFTEDLPFKAATEIDPYEKLRKQAPQQQRKSIVRLLAKEKEEALREKLNTGKLTAELRKTHADDLLVTEQEIANKVWQINK